ncbi:hypothetical protein ACJMK2_011899 [Sinanodonta woodiana]|uniref:Integrase core domain-containing protein n=1 Tax=Sinanodonta woodiana TaxID=1069815 RepID=A0ABD3V6H1_SINWO
MGTENVRVAAMQKFLGRSDGLDIKNDRTFIYGKSTLNTRIESWWGILRKECCQIWMEELKVLRDSGFFSGNALDINLVQFCLMRLLQVQNEYLVSFPDELDDVMMVWNTHRIRANQTNSPAGRPLSLHLLPYMENVEDHLCDVLEEEIEVCRMKCAEETIYTCEEELFELCCLHKEEKQLESTESYYRSHILIFTLSQLAFNTTVTVLMPDVAISIHLNLSQKHSSMHVSSS